MRHLVWFLSALSTLLGCQKPPSQPVPETIPTATTAAVRGPAYLVVEQKEKGYATHWLERTVDGYQHRGTRDDVVVAAAGQLWLRKTPSSEVSGFDCDCVMEKEGDGPRLSDIPQCRATTKQVYLDFASTDGQRVTAIRPAEEVVPAAVRSKCPPPTEDAIVLCNDRHKFWEAEVSRRIWLRAVWGPLLFITDSDWSEHCDSVHGHLSVRFTVFDLARGTVVDTWPAESRQALEAEYRADAVEKICHDSNQQCLVGVDPDPELTLFYPVIVAGQAQVLLQYTMSSSFASSDGRWNGYTRSERLVVDRFATVPGTWIDVPDAVASYAERHANANLIGFSVLTEPAVGHQPSAQGFEPLETPDVDKPQQAGRAASSSPSVELELVGCDATRPQVGQWRPAQEDLESAIRAANGGWCGRNSVAGLSRKARECAERVGSTTLSMDVVGRGRDADRWRCSLVVGAATWRDRRWIALRTTPAADYRVDTFEVLHDGQLVPYVRGHPYHQPYCAPIGWPHLPGPEQFISATMKNEWSNLPPALRDAICYAR